MGRHQVSPDGAARQISAHIGKFGHRDQIQNIKLPCYSAGARAWRQINDLRDEIVKPEHVEQTKQRVSHRL